MNILNKIKKNLSGILVGAAILGAALIVSSVASATVFPSQQVGTSPVNGYYLQTNGVTSTWAAVSGGGVTSFNGATGTVIFSTSTFSTSSISGTSGTIPMFSGTQNLINSLLSQLGSAITALGNLFVSGTLNVTSTATTNGITNTGNVTSTNLSITALGGTGTPCLDIANSAGAVATTTCGSASSGITGNGTSTWMAIWNTSSSIIGFANVQASTSTGQTKLPCTADSAGGSQSVGGCLNINGTNSTSSPFVIYDNQTAEVSGQMAQATCDTGFNTFDCFVIRNLATGTTALDLQGNPTGKGVLKIEVNAASAGSQASASGISITINNTSSKGIFIDSASSTTGQEIDIRDNGTDYFTLAPFGAGFNVNTTSTFGSSTIFLGNVSTTIAANSFVATNGQGILVATGTPSGGGSVAGSQTQIQYNDGGAFAATSTLTFTSSTEQLDMNSASSNVVIGNKYFLASSTSFSETGATSSWTVPTGVTSITITATGAAGSAAQNGTSPANGAGGSIEAGTLAVTPGTILYYCVAGAASGGSGGFCGGGNGGGGGGGNPDGGAGGGASWIGTSGTYSTSTALIVAAGGGGGGASGGGTPGHGGGGGGSTGTAGTNGTATGGGGGTQSAGGSAGSNSGGGTAATAGTALNGGNGGEGGSFSGGGGGGGGFFGGGGGGGTEGTTAGAGGGGGSSYATSSATNVTNTASTTAAGVNGSIIISYNISTTVPPDGVIDADGHYITGGVIPTISSCGANPSVSGNDTAGIITLGSGVITSCTLTYGTPYTNYPIPVANLNVTGLPLGITTNGTSSVTFSAATTFGGDSLYYQILGK